MAVSVIENILHWKKKLDQEDQNEEVILNVIHKLSKIPIKFETLEATHIGKTIRKMSKRSGKVGEKALALLTKWRNEFAKTEINTANGNSTSSVSSKENKNKSYGKLDILSCEKTFHQNNASNNEQNRKRENNLSSSEASLYVERDNPDESFTVKKKILIPNPAVCAYEKKKTEAKYMDYKPHVHISKGYNHELPELFPGENSQTTGKQDLIGNVERKVSQKRKLKALDQTESLSKSKRFKSQSHLNSDSVYTDESKIKKEKKDKDPKLYSSSIKMESCTYKEKPNSVCAEKHNLPAVTKKSKGKEKKSNDSSSTKCNKSKQNELKLNCSEEFTSSEVRFEDCLVFNDIVPLKKKKSSKSQSANKKTITTDDTKIKCATSSSSGQEIKIPKQSSSEKCCIKIPKPSAKLDAVNIVSTLPEIQTYYQDFPQTSQDFCSSKKKALLTNEDAIRFTSSRKEKTAVYSGRRSHLSEVPSLSNCCIKVLIENVDAIEYMGEVPFFLLKPILEKCTANQLFNIEHYNPHFLETTNELWEIHCRRDYKLLSPQENETWRDLYLRAHDERKQKLKSVTANISASISKSTPVRQVKLAFVDSVAKPPRDVARRQAKNGTVNQVKHVVKAGPSSRMTPKPSASVASLEASSSKIIPRPTARPVPVAPVTSSFVNKKPKVAPLMAKTLKTMKQCFRR